MQFVTATGPLLERILDGTFTIWSEGLSRPAYSRWNRALMETSWGRARMHRIALLRGDDVVASAKRYDFDARLDGAPVQVLGIGAVFTPPEHRGRGHARALIRHLLEDAAGRGCGLALLFSEIGPAFYESFGFRVIPREYLTLEPIVKPGAPAVLVRSAERADLPAVAGIAAASAHGAAFSLDRSPDSIVFNIARRRLLAGLGPAGLRQVEFFVTEEGHRAVAYVLLTRGPAGVFLEECGDRDPSGARIGAMLQVLTARTPAEAPLRMRAWMPASLRPPQLRVLAREPAAELMMVKVLGPEADRVRLEPIMLWQSEVF
jgi:predicted N-acetyltransferase YhbS